jgi:hypothetical protein
VHKYFVLTRGTTRITAGRSLSILVSIAGHAAGPDDSLRDDAAVHNMTLALGAGGETVFYVGVSS